MHGRRYCAAHRNLNLLDATPNPSDDETELEARARRSDTFAQAARAGRREDLIDRTVRKVIVALGEDRALQEEIGALRIVLQRVLAMDALEGDPAETAMTATRLVDAITRAVKVQRLISDEMANNVASALTTVLIEMGLEARDG